MFDRDFSCCFQSPAPCTPPVWGESCVRQKTIRCLRIPLPCSFSPATPFRLWWTSCPTALQGTLFYSLLRRCTLFPPPILKDIWHLKDTFCCPCVAGVSQWTCPPQNRVHISFLRELSPELALAQNLFSPSQERKVFIRYHLSSYPLSITWSFTSQVFPLHLATSSSTSQARCSSPSFEPCQHITRVGQNN